MMQHVTIGLIGLGTVGTGVARLLTEHSERIARRAGRPIRWKWAAVRDLRKPRGVSLEGVKLTTRRPAGDRRSRGRRRHRDDGRARAGPGVRSCSARGGQARRHGQQGAAGGAWTEDLRARARSAGAVAFEGSVGGGIPIVQALGFALAANQVQSLAAIVNGTCNFILTRMTSEGLSYEEALRQAQELGYAEADPTLDVDGTDTAHKLAILAQLAFETDVRPDAIPRQGIDSLHLADLKYAGELGYTIKLLALAKLSAAGLELRVAPTLVKRGRPLAEVGGPYNAIRVVGDAVGDTLFYGRGAGAMPTASAVVGDLIDVVTGRARPPAQSISGRFRASVPDLPHTTKSGQVSLLSPVHHRGSARACLASWRRSSASEASASPA